jgi:transcriptional regulator with XRE-family HTH domain
MSLAKHIGNQVRQARKHAGITQAELAEAMQRTRSAIIDIEAGRRHITAEHLWQIAQILSCPISFFFPDNQN